MTLSTMTPKNEYRGMDRCHCGGRYQALPRTASERNQNLGTPARCARCGAFRYLNQREALLAWGVNR